MIASELTARMATIQNLLLMTVPSFLCFQCSVSQLPEHNFGTSVVPAVYDRRLYSSSRATCLQRDTIKPAVIDRRYKGPLPNKYNVHAIERHYTRTHTCALAP